MLDTPDHSRHLNPTQPPPAIGSKQRRMCDYLVLTPYSLSSLAPFGQLQQNSPHWLAAGPSLQMLLLSCAPCRDGRMERPFSPCGCHHEASGAGDTSSACLCATSRGLMLGMQTASTAAGLPGWASVNTEQCPRSRSSTQEGKKSEGIPFAAQF